MSNKIELFAWLNTLCRLCCKMNVIACVVLIVSINTVRAIRRIPLSRQGANDKKDTEEYFLGSYDYNPLIETQLNPVEERNEADTKNEDYNGLKFTEFLVEAAKVLKTYNNKVLEQAFAVLDDSMKDVYEGCKANELTQIKKYASRQLRLLKDSPANILRKYLDYIINVIGKKDFGEVNDLVNYINSLYAEEHDQFIEVLLELVHKRMSPNVDVASTLKQALKVLIFDHYCNLDDVVRHELQKMIKHYWRQFISQVVHENLRSNSGRLPFVTPFVYENRKELKHKKRRFYKVNAGKPLEARWNDDEDAGTGDKEAGLDDRYAASDFSEKLNSQEKTLHSTNSSDDSQIYRSKTSTVGKPSYESDDADMNDSLFHKNSSIDSFEGNTQSHSIAAITDETMATNRITRFSHVISSTKDIPKDTNNTIEKLIRIGSLAKEIKDILRTDGPVLRQTSDDLKFNSALAIDLFDARPFMLPLLPTLPVKNDKIKKRKINDKKDVLISMSAKYKE